MKTILYVEDDEHDMFFLNRAFGTHAPELRIQNVPSVPDAMQYIEGMDKYSDRAQFPPADLVISDVTIPGGSGFQLVKWIRGHAKFAKLPVILLTGSVHESQVDTALTTGADCCLEKSSDFKQLLGNVRGLLGL